MKESLLAWEMRGLSSCTPSLGEVKCLHCELEAEKSVMEQDRMDVEQQLSQKEQQYQDTLNLQQTVYEKERNKLIQELVRDMMATIKWDSQWL